MSLRCVYTDLDGTLLGQRGSLFRDAEGNFSLKQARALEACHRADAEVVIMSGRREAQVSADARLLGQTSYIYEAGCGVVIDGERTLLTGDWVPDEDGTPAEKMLAAGVPDLLFERFPGRLEWHAPWHPDRELSHLFRGQVDVAEANALLAEHGHDDLRFLDNGAIVRPHGGARRARPRLPPGARRRQQGEGRRLPHAGPRLRARGVHRGRRLARGPRCCAAPSGSFFVVANGPERDPGLREAIGGRPNVTVTEGRNGDGVYEAVVSTLAERRSSRGAGRRLPRGCDGAERR